MNTVHQETQDIANNSEPAGDFAWNDLNQVYLNCHALALSPSRIMPLVKDPAQLENVENGTALVDQIKVLSKDVAYYNQRLKDIHSKHVNRTGSTTSPDELMTVLRIGEEYQEWLVSYQTVVMPLVVSILEVFEPNANTTVN